MSTVGKIVFPKPLPELNKDNIPNEIGLTSSEILTLQNVWALFKRRTGYHASQIFLNFFTEHDFLIERFRDPISGKFKLTYLHQHPSKIFLTFGQVIESSLHNAAYFHILMKDIRSTHEQYGITFDDVKLHMDYIIHYIMQQFISKKSPTLESALNKLGDIINNQHINQKQSELDENLESK